MLTGVIFLVLGNILVHDYLGGIDLNTVWDVVENYLDNLREQILRHLESVNT
jgi:uncharacterized protein with HEPN domain